MRFSLIFMFLTLSACSFNKTARTHLNHLTLKLEKPLNIQLNRQGKNNSNFNILAEIKSKDPVLSGEITWFIVDEQDQKIYQKTESINNNAKFLKYDSGNLNIPNEEENYKIIFKFSGKTANDEIHKTAIYNSLIQDDIDNALIDLQERARNN